MDIPSSLLSLSLRFHDRPRQSKTAAVSLGSSFFRYVSSWICRRRFTVHNPNDRSFPITDYSLVPSTATTIDILLLLIGSGRVSSAVVRTLKHDLRTVPFDSHRSIHIVRFTSFDPYPSIRIILLSRYTDK